MHFHSQLVEVFPLKGLSVLRLLWYAEFIYKTICISNGTGMFAIRKVNYSKRYILWHSEFNSTICAKQMVFLIIKKRNRWTYRTKHHNKYSQILQVSNVQSSFTEKYESKGYMHPEHNWSGSEKVWIQSIHASRA